MASELFNIAQARRDLGLDGSTVSERPTLERIDEDPIARRLKVMAEEVTPKPRLGKSRSDK